MLPRLEMFKSAIFAHRIVSYNESFVPVGKKQNIQSPLLPFGTNPCLGDLKMC